MKVDQITKILNVFGEKYQHVLKITHIEFRFDKFSSTEIEYCTISNQDSSLYSGGFTWIWAEDSPEEYRKIFSIRDESIRKFLFEVLDSHQSETMLAHTWKRVRLEELLNLIPVACSL